MASPPRARLMTTAAWAMLACAGALGTSPWPSTPRRSTYRAPSAFASSPLGHAAQSIGAALALTACTPTAAPAVLAPPNALVAEAWRVVDRNYVDRSFNGADWFALRQQRVSAKYKSPEEAHEAIRSMLQPLGDKFTRFLTPAQFESIESAARGGVAGVGVELAPLPETDGGVRVTRVIEASPAEKAGLRAGEVIVKVNQQPLKAPLTADDIASLIRGAPDTRVVLTVQERTFSAGGEAPAVRNVDLERAPVKLISVKQSGGSVQGKSALVIEIRSFSVDTPAQVKMALGEGAKKKPGVIVLDLRGNGGGSLQGGIDVARFFLPDGAKIVSVSDKTGATRTYEAENGGALDTTTPVVALVNHDTASAAEVLSAALGDNGRATIVGEKTYGKGVIQTLAKLEQGGGGGVAFTTARYFTPNGRSINKVGIEPDMGTAGDAEACLASGGAGKGAAECVPGAAIAPPKLL